MASKHLFKLRQTSPHDHTPAGSRTKANKQIFPALQGMALYHLILEPRGVREPHWHPNADELGYCLKGQVLVSLYHTGDVKATFLVEEGDVFFIPSGALHHIENVGEGRAELVLQFSNELPEDFNLSSSFGAFSDEVLGSTWSVKPEVFHALKRSMKSTFAALRSSDGEIPVDARYATPYRYHLEAGEPLLVNEGGSARMARRNVWPIVEHQALYSLRLTKKGMREPHWHPKTAELGYVAKGKGRMSILNPEGKVDTYEMEEGDVYFIPKGYPHHIETLSDKELHILVFFDQGMPGDIGFSASVRSYSEEVLASSLGCSPQFFEALPKYYADLFIVKAQGRSN